MSLGLLRSGTSSPSCDSFRAHTLHRARSSTSVQLTQLLHSARFAMARRLLNIILVILMAGTLMDVGAASGGPASSEQLISAVCLGSRLSCMNSDNLALRPASSDDSLRDEFMVTINDLQRDFFLEETLVEGGFLTLDENLRDPAPRRPFLTSAAAASLPTGARDMIRHFGLAPGSSMAKDVATSAYLCSSPALPGEAFRCAASVDAVGAFVAAELGRSVNVYKTTGVPSSAHAVRAPVKVMGVAKRSVAEGKKIVVCHHVGFPAMLYYCHCVTGTKVVQADLKPVVGTRVGEPRSINAVAVCHLDTSMWLSRHPAFKALNIAHGAAACHFLVENDLVFTPAASGGA